MDYEIIMSSRTLKEYKNAISYYALNSYSAPTNFVTAIENAFGVLAKNPFFRIRYKNVRALKVKRFPYLLYFVINENNHTVKILSCFHTKRNPERRPRIS